MRAQGREPREAHELIPTNFVFKGPLGEIFGSVALQVRWSLMPWSIGTGKTTTARKMGQVYYSMGFLSSTEVVECAASDLGDLGGEYVGQTGPKKKKLFDSALGKVLFIDEAYRPSEGHFAKEAIHELVGILTQDSESLGSRARPLETRWSGAGAGAQMQRAVRGESRAAVGMAATQDASCKAT